MQSPNQLSTVLSYMKHMYELMGSETIPYNHLPAIRKLPVFEYFSVLHPSLAPNPSITNNVQIVDQLMRNVLDEQFKSLHKQYMRTTTGTPPSGHFELHDGRWIAQLQVASLQFYYGETTEDLHACRLVMEYLHWLHFHSANAAFAIETSRYMPDHLPLARLMCYLGYSDISDLLYQYPRDYEYIHSLGMFLDLCVPTTTD